MQEVTVVGLDLAKKVFQVHGVAADGGVVFRRQLRRAQVLSFFEGLSPCLVGLEACASADRWPREIGGSGHEPFRSCAKVWSWRRAALAVSSIERDGFARGG